ncbi:MAG: hypothetical protein PHG65_07015, partial [Kiritimatiellae bacterium]|nr:hypothetical protein [Kiritimatiellia bacterium]
MAEGDLPYVWPDVDGTVRGFELPPLYKSVPKAAKQDFLLYELLALVDALRIGRAREKSMAMKELKKRIFPTESVPVNVGPWGINETTIKEWVGACTGSEQILPDLIRRLVLFLVPRGQLAHAHFPAGKEVHQSGSDGEFITHGPSFFAPQTEQSVWEISTEKDILGKLKKDYDAYLPFDETQQEKQKQQNKLPNGMESSTATYVAVTGRIADQKAKKWLEEKKAEGRWADVRLYDAVDIAQWLALAPVVSSWFRGVLGSPQDGLFSVEEYFNAWAHRPERLPPLTEQVVLAGRKDEQEALAKRLREKSERIRVRSDDPDESFVFLCAVILSMPEDSPERTDLLARTMIVTSSEAWSRLLKQIRGMSGLILVPAFDEYDGNTYGCAEHIVYMQVRDGAEIELKPIDREALAKALWDMMGKAEGGEDGARKKAYDCGGRLSSLQRLHGYQPPLPDWAHDANIHVILSALLLCGSWRPNNPTDRAILEKLSNGRSYSDIEALVQKLMNQVKDPPLRTQSCCIKWRSSQDAWGRLVKIIIPSALDQFYSVCAEVLGKESPRYNLSPDERLLADTDKTTLPESDELRNGLAESLAMLRVMAGQLPKPSSEAEVHSRLDSTVQSILSGGTWKRWASLGSRLPDLAEAAPKAFLEVLERVLADDAERVKPLFEQESSKYALFSECCQTGLLWALELLAWHPTHFPYAVSALIRLCALDTGKSNSTNRPENCLFSLFEPDIRQTAATNKQRLAALRKMESSMQRRVVSHVLDMCVNGGCESSNYRPKFSTWDIPYELEPYSTKEVMEFVSAIRNLAITSITTDVDHLVELFNNNGIEMIVVDAFRIMQEKLEDYRLQGSDLLRSLCACLRRWLKYQYLMHKDDLPEERILVAKNLIEQLEPSDVVERNAWLFSQNATVPEPIEEGDYGKIREQRLNEQRRAALLEVLQGEDAFHRLLDLARKAPSPYLIAWSLTSADVGDPFECDLIYEALPQEGKINELARSFCRR